MDKIDVFTDGGCSGNPGPGGWAYVLLCNGKVLSYGSGGEENTTNNKMELTAVISAIEACNIIGAKEISISTDSQYVKNGITTWIFNWKKNNWKTASKDPVKNKELWEKLDSLNNSNIKWLWVKGHAGITYNEMCDSMVRNEMKRFMI
ncbi:MAG: ribonuclease HI [Sphaerochaetaceae bacterium]|nr:ribonuclease HI [Sphaerochaetaceae bacterium]